MGLILIDINTSFPSNRILLGWKEKKLSLRSPLYSGVSCQEGTGTHYLPQLLFMHRIPLSGTNNFFTAFLRTHTSTEILYHRALFCSSTLLGRSSASSWRAGVQSNFRLGFSNATEGLRSAGPYWARLS